MVRSRTAETDRRASNGQQKGVLGPLSRFWQRSYAADYIAFVFLLIAFLLLEMIEPFHRMFSLDNIAIQYPYAAVERVPSSYNMLYAGVIPLLIIILWAAVFQPGMHKAHVTILGLLISLVLASVLADLVKNAVGRPRPDLLARCKPVKGTPKHELVTIDICTETDHHKLHDGWRSFPSGHSTFAFSGLGFLALFFAGQMHVFRPRTDLARVLLALAPLVGAALIAISRCEDYRHDVYDVTIGSILGMLVADFSYRRYYPELKTSRCDVPYPSRAETASLQGYGKVKDEEERIQGVGNSATDDIEDDSDHITLRNTRID